MEVDLYLKTEQPRFKESRSPDISLITKNTAAMENSSHRKHVRCSDDTLGEEARQSFLRYSGLGLDHPMVVG